MSLLTRCPRCKTLFRVAPAQLQARAGQVRCGRCLNVFDGFQALAVEQSGSPGEVEDVEPAHATVQSAAPAVDAPAASAVLPVEPVVTPVSAMLSSDASHVPPIPLPARAPLADRFKRKLTVRTKWAGACVLLGVLLGIQVAYAFRSDIAARYPAFRAELSDWCKWVGCTVSLPQRPHLVRIEASDVHMIDPSRPSLIQVTATLRSYANYDLAYPALDLVLTNANEHALARRIFVPAEYLDRTRDPKAGIPPRGEFTVALDLDTGDLKAAGFRLDLLAAPAP